MAIVKFVTARCPMNNIFQYVTRKEATERKLIDGVAKTNFEGLDLVELIVYAHPTDPATFCPSAAFIKETFARVRAAGKKPMVMVWSEGDKVQTYRNLANLLGDVLFGTDYPETLEEYFRTK